MSSFEHDLSLAGAFSSSSRRRLLDGALLFWLLFALPSLPMLGLALRIDDLGAVHHPAGGLAARLVMLTLILTPLCMLLPGQDWLGWLARRRRALGMAALGHTVLHGLGYLVDLRAMDPALRDAVKACICIGWAVFVLAAPLAIASTDGRARLLRRRWKTLWRVLHVAALATVTRWIFLNNPLGPALVHFLPLALLEGWRAWRVYLARPAPAG